MTAELLVSFGMHCVFMCNQAVCCNQLLVACLNLQYSSAGFALAAGPIFKVLYSRVYKHADAQELRAQSCYVSVSVTACVREVPLLFLVLANKKVLQPQLHWQ